MIDANINHVQTNLDFTSHQITINIEAQYPPQCKRLKHHLVLEALADWIRQSPKSLPCLVSVTCAKLDGLGATVGGPSPSPSPSPASSSSPPSSPPASAPASPPASPPAQGHHPHHHHHHHHSSWSFDTSAMSFPRLPCMSIVVNWGDHQLPAICSHRPLPCSLASISGFRVSHQPLQGVAQGHLLVPFPCLSTQKMKPD